MKHTRLISSLSIILVMFIISSCQEDITDPKPRIDIKSLMKETVLFSLDSDNYLKSDEYGYLFNSEKYISKLSKDYEFLLTSPLELSNIHFNGQNSLEIKHEFNQNITKQFDEYHEQILDLARSQKVGQSDAYFLELEKIAKQITESTLTLESKHALLNTIQFSYVAYLAIDELSLEFTEPHLTSKSVASGVQSVCKFDWNDVLNSALVDMAWGAVIGGVTIGIIGGVAGMGFATPITGLAGAFAGANMGAAAGFVEGFARGVVNNTIKYLWCKYA